jgi:alkanesulfonate monooxygenase SsuD/methylene tetrahydromethanopterin reductase-like flavin-dependent oxidoreductase (luciferase family)
LQKPHPPIVIGGNRAPALRRVAQLADGWHPMGVSPTGVTERLRVIREEAEATGRADTKFLVQVRRDFDGVDAELIQAYEDAGVTDLVLSCNTGDVGRISDTLAAFAARHIQP